MMVGSLTKVSLKYCCGTVVNVMNSGDYFRKIEELHISDHIRDSRLSDVQQ